MRNEIILIGPMGVGKTYTSELLSKKLGKPHIWVDAVRFEYYGQIGCDCEKAERRRYSVYEGELFERAQRLLSDFTNIFLLLPSPDADESLEFLMKRKNISENDEDGKERLRYFISHPSNFALCRHTVYVKGKNDDEICNEIINKSKL